MARFWHPNIKLEKRHHKLTSQQYFTKRIITFAWHGFDIPKVKLEKKEGAS